MPFQKSSCHIPRYMILRKYPLLAFQLNSHQIAEPTARDIRTSIAGLSKMNNNIYGTPVHRPLVPYPPWRDDGRMIYGHQTQYTPGNHYAWDRHLTPSAPTTTYWDPINPNATASDSTSTTDTCTSCGNTVNLKPTTLTTKKAKPKPPSSITATITTTKTTKTTTQKQIHIPNPGIDTALHNLNYEIHSSLKTYHHLLNSFLVQTALLRSSGSVDAKTLDVIWRSKINTKITDSNNPEQKRERIEFVGARISYYRQSIREAIDTARNSLSLLDHVHTAGNGKSDKGKAKAVYKTPHPRYHDPSDDDDDDDDNSSDARITISKGVMDKLKLLQRQVRIAEKAVGYCDAFLSLQPEHGANEYAVGYDIVASLKHMSDAFREWRKKYDWMCEFPPAPLIVLDNTPGNFTSNSRGNS